MVQGKEAAVTCDSDDCNCDKAEIVKVQKAQPGQTPLYNK